MDSFCVKAINMARLEMNTKEISVVDLRRYYCDNCKHRLACMLNAEQAIINKRSFEARDQ